MSLFRRKYLEKQVKRLRNGYITDTLTSVDIQKIVKIRGKVIEIYERIKITENYKVFPFKNFVEKKLNLGFQNERAGNVEKNKLIQDTGKGINAQTIKR